MPALAWQRLADEEVAEEAEEERRLFYVAMTRARERLILSGGVDCERWPEPRRGGPPMDWIARALTDDPRSVFTVPETVVERRFEDRPARLRCVLNSPATLDIVLPRAALAPAGRPRAGAPATALPDAPAVLPAAPAWPRPAPQRLSYSSLGAYARCGYRFYLQRLLRLPPVTPPPRPEAPREPALAPTVRGSIVHRLLEELDFSRPAAPDPAVVVELAGEWGVELTDDEVADIRALVDAFAASPLCARLAAARRTRREAAVRVRARPGGRRPAGHRLPRRRSRSSRTAGALIVDYKSDRLEGADPPSVVDRDYATQVVVYALAALRDGAPRAEVAYCFLERPGEPVTRAFTAADATALTEHLAGAGARRDRGRLSGRRGAAPRAVRRLPGPGALCSWSEDMTLRELPANGGIEGGTLSPRRAPSAGAPDLVAARQAAGTGGDR